jgi:hypothetical protein
VLISNTADAIDRADFSFHFERALRSTLKSQRAASIERAHGRVLSTSGIEERKSRPRNRPRSEREKKSGQSYLVRSGPSLLVRADRPRIERASIRRRTNAPISDAMRRDASRRPSQSEMKRGMKTEFHRIDGPWHRKQRALSTRVCCEVHRARKGPGEGGRGGEETAFYRYEGERDERRGGRGRDREREGERETGNTADARGGRGGAGRTRGKRVHREMSRLSNDR